MSKELQHKMYDYEVNPPAGAWEKITRALDESYLANEFPSTLHDLEVRPPATAWEKIRSSLEPLPLQKRRITPFLRYAAAAVFIAGLALAGIQLLKGSLRQKEIDKEAAIANDKKDVPASINKNTIDVAVLGGSNTLSKPELPLRSKTSIINSNNLPKPLRSRKPVVALNAADDYQHLHDAGTAAIATATHSETGLGMDRYIMLMTPDGNIIRMSKKLSHLLCCVSGEEQDADCKTQLQQWREKLACSTVTASPGNFMDIFSLVSSLQNASN